MERFYGFDLGDAESAVSRLEKGSAEAPEQLEICGAKSFISAYAQLRTGEILVGEQACYHADAIKRKLRFKSHFLTDPGCADDVKTFAAGVLGELYGSAALIKNDDTSFYIGCPAGWDGNTREFYRSIFEQAGYPPAKIVSESRAALISACQSRHLQIGHDIMSKPVLVVDIGSSTTDFAYIMGGKEVEMQTAGEVVLGGGIMDEILLDEAIEGSLFSRRIRQTLENSEAWKNYCEFAARRLKEKYFSDEAYWKVNPCKESVMIRYREPLKLTITMDEKIAKKLLEKKVERLGNRSFREVFVQSLYDVRDNIKGSKPELLFLTGGVSKLPEIREWCAEVFPEAIVIRGSEPEFSVSKGLAWSGRIDEDMREFREEVDQLMKSAKVEDIVERHIEELYKGTVDALIDPILEKVAEPVFLRWRNGELRKLSDADEVLKNDIAAFVRSEEARALLVKPITSWLKPVAEELEEYTVPICVRHNVPYSSMSLRSFLQVSDLDISLDARNIFAVEEITLMIDSIISIIIGLLCGGSGAALVLEGPIGILAGITLSFIVLILGRRKMEEALLNMDIPGPMRKVVPKAAFRSRMDAISDGVKENFYKSLEKDKSDEITKRMVEDISAQIEMCLEKMAEVVEIPLG